MITYILLLVGGVIVAAMAGYAGWLLLALQKQKKALANARQARVERLKESIIIIAKAMQTGECNHSEGVIRLRMLLDPLGKRLRAYSAMWELYEVVQNMPTHEARGNQPKQERMKQDLTRMKSETKLEAKIKLELHQLLNDIEML
ncbi:uncharacterized protein DUF2489 [Cricetibacter osteomyelitidis]|uniref:Uncharacterized protein DUF2489 n=1 Tax=Cricetibacter osteomyelitidis TaxID=1521931 RepID=A0A4R2TFE0_9PAST|nr:DUF2489 domain-containing protein [Cricetibacter osteomyelitidis]TCP93432.1 uncharacterized protein DUF2489 [Cricetibacter osteomyelitidis]